MTMMGLRLAEGVPLERFAAESGLPFEQALDPQKLDRLTESGFLSVDGGRLRATAEGRTRLNAVLGALLA
jgi:oxygen-independent coproporphyrinogen-3 oxidase